MYDTSAVGPDGMSVPHLRLLLRDGTHDRTQHHGENIALQYLQIAADGRLFLGTAELYASARLIAIQKPPEPNQPPGIRLIVIRTVFRRLVSTMVLAKSVEETSEFLLPQKVSLALNAGTEVLIHGLHDVSKAHFLDIGKVLL